MFRSRAPGRAIRGAAAALALSLALSPAGGRVQAAEPGQALEPWEPWKVRRDQPAALRQQALRALLAAPENPGLARALLRSTPAAQRARLLDQVAALADQSPPSYAARMAHGQLLLALGRPAPAAEAFEQAAGLKPEHPAPRWALARALEAAHRLEPALSAYEDAAARERTPARQRRALLAAAGLAGRLDPARELILRQRLFQLAPGDEAALELGQSLGRTGGAAEGARLLERQGARANTATQRRRLLAKAAELHEAVGDHEAALTVWQRLGANERDQAALLRLLDRLGRQDELGRRFDRLASTGARLDLLLPVVERAYDQGDRPRAQARFDRLLKSVRRNRAALLKLADLASRFDDHERVLASWDVLFALDPGDEQAIIGLGEAQLARGRRELARRTWGALLRARRPAAEAHARLADILSDHDMLDDAVVQAQAARRLQPNEPSHHRTLARILEKRREPTAAIAAWRAVLQASAAVDQESARREARGRILALLAREGRERLRAETVLLKDRARRHPEDRETALYLAELQLRLQEPAAAVETLTATGERNAGDAEVVLMLVRLLRQSRQTERALTWLSRLAVAVPARAAEALLQVAGMRLDRYEDDQAFAAAERAVQLADGASEVILRAAEVAERAGRTDAARTFLSRVPRDARVALAAARLEIRQGDHRRALDLLLSAAQASDPAGRADLLGEALHIAEAANDAAGALARFPRGAVGPLPPPLGEAERTLIVQLARRAARDTAGAHPALTGMASEAIMQAIDDPRRPPEPAEVELLGKLGNRDAVPRLLRLARASAGGAGAGIVVEYQASVAAVVALGRLADPRSRQQLETLTQAPNVRVREAATWALGRLADPRSLPAFVRASEDPRQEVRAWALIGLGRLPDAPMALIERAALDPAAPIDVRRAAVLALVAEPWSSSSSSGMRGDQRAASLAALVSASDPTLAGCAAVALAALGTAEALPALWRLALLGDGAPRRFGLQALGSLAAERHRDDRLAPPPHLPRLPDPTVLIEGAELRTGQLVDRMCEGRPPGGGQAVGPAQAEALEQLWVEHAQEIGALLGEALAVGGGEARRALAALSGAPGTLFAPQSRPRVAALATLRQRLEAPLGRALVATDWSVRIAAVRAAAFLQDPRLVEAHIVSLLVGPQARDDAEAAAIAAVTSLRAQGRLDSRVLTSGLRPLLRHPAWQTRLTGLRVMLQAAQLPPDVRAAAMADPNPFVRAEARRQPQQQTQP